ncbi:uncharacterized protein LOC134765876 [Penaeus indicus]|uniref:uncharacterized protein LOC134765876 n=1 Tax=Penaeus indicus TaxID=29960 RepID=UPI00300CAB89
MRLFLVQALLVTLSAASEDFDLTLFCCPTNDRILTELQKVQDIDDKLATLTSTIRKLQEAMTKQHTAVIHQVEITRRQVEELTAKIEQMDTRREESDRQMAEFMAGTEDYLATVASRFQELLEILEKQYKASGRGRQELEKKVDILDIIQRQTAMDVYTLMTDVDECLLGNATCHPTANCNNIAGSFLCLCDGGHVGGGDLPCVDIDECTEGLHDCHGNATCTNLKGGFNCTCLPGYEGDGRTCVGELQVLQEGLVVGGAGDSGAVASVAGASGISGTVAIASGAVAIVTGASGTGLGVVGASCAYNVQVGEIPCPTLKFPQTIRITQAYTLNIAQTTTISDYNFDQPRPQLPMCKKRKLTLPSHQALLHQHGGVSTFALSATEGTRDGFLTVPVMFV